MTTSPLCHPVQLAQGLWLLALLVLRTRCRLTGPYWQWRRATALGTSTSVPRSQRRRGILAYARWMALMRQLR